MVSHPDKAEMTKVRMTKIFSSIDRFVIRLAPGDKFHAPPLTHRAV